MKTISMTSGSKLTRESQFGQEEYQTGQNKSVLCGGKTTGRWTKQEHLKFMDGLKMFGQNWKKVEEHIGTRSGAQIRSHAQQFFNRLEQEYNASTSQQSYGNDDHFDDSSFDMNESERENTMNSNLQIMATLKGKISKKITVDDQKINNIEEEEVLPLSNLNATLTSFSEANLDDIKFQNVLNDQSKVSSQEATPTMQSQDALFVKSDTSYFNFILSQINLDLIKIPKLYDLCGWGFEQRVSKPQEMDNEVPSFNQHNSNKFKYQSFKIYEEVVDASKQIKLKNLRRKCSLDSESITKKFQKNNHFDEMSINSNSDLTEISN